MTLLPGITSTTRTLTAPTARAPGPWRDAVIWLAFTPGAGRSSKRVTTGPGCTATTSASMPKSLSFISTRRDSASSASAEYSGSRGGGSSSSFSGGSSLGLGGVEQRHLALLLDALALLHGGCGRLDARRRARRGLLLLGLAPLPCAPAAARAPRPARASCASACATSSRPAQPAVPKPIHDGEPGDVEGERQPGHPGGDHQQGGAEEVQRRPRDCRPTTLPTTPPAVWRRTPGCQCSVVRPQLATSTSRTRRRAPRCSPARRPRSSCVAAIPSRPRPASPGTGRPDGRRGRTARRRARRRPRRCGCAPARGAAGEREAGIVRAVGGQRDEQHQRHDGDGDDGALAQAAS